MNIILDRMRHEREYGQLKLSYERVRGEKRRYPFLVTGLCEGALDAFLAAFASDEKHGTSLVIARDEASAERIRAYLSACGLRTKFYPSRRPVLYNIVSSHELEHARISCLADIICGNIDVVVTVPEAAIQYTISKEKLSEHMRDISVGDTLDIREFAKFLTDSGYVSCDLVDGRGKFSTRGGIIDVFPPQSDNPIRMELFGDEVDSIGYFDVMTQRKTENIRSFSVVSAREVLVDEDTRKSLSAHISEMAKKAVDVSSKASLMTEKECVENLIKTPFIDKYISYIYKEPASLLDYFDKGDTLTFVIDHASMSDRLKGYEMQSAEDIRELLEASMISPKYKDFAYPADTVFSFFDNNAAIVISDFIAKYPGKLSEMFTFFTRKPPSFSESFENLSDDIREFVKNGYSVLKAFEISFSA